LESCEEFYDGRSICSNSWKKTIIAKVGPDKIDDEMRRVTRNKEWYNIVEDSESKDDKVISHCHHHEAGGTIIL
jgi:hypothetical protein